MCGEGSGEAFAIGLRSIGVPPCGLWRFVGVPPYGLWRFVGVPPPCGLWRDCGFVWKEKPVGVVGVEPNGVVGSE